LARWISGSCFSFWSLKNKMIPMINKN
jgi:hypothetical protein